MIFLLLIWSLGGHAAGAFDAEMAPVEVGGDSSFQYYMLKPGCYLCENLKSLRLHPACYY